MRKGKSLKRGSVNFPPLKVGSLSNLDDNCIEDVATKNNSCLLNFIAFKHAQFVKRG